MATNEATVDRPGRERRFEYAGSVVGYVTVMVRLVVGYWFLHAGWGMFGFVAGEPFDDGGYLANADGSPIAGLFAAVAETP